ncbi:hypothetical protein [Bacillus sp. S/N-304-OC-R1]|uniref:hypothetical protein n=1 Tax=Bacillus sp. S/N-304-OC-R1 TaxID=2758034 RepID=UPI001C8D6945|nr:hypothetical protein [Bacillus sp. S/N-304-OC-R1]MBY0122134.1 hypothetical protein [Bacillus sp. S/N-304-OC-R1]
MLAFREKGVTYHIFATKDEVTVYAATKTFAVNAKGKTFKETIAKAKKAVRKEAPLK